MQRTLLATLALLAITLPLVQGANFSENYETDSIGSAPDDNWYVFNQGVTGGYVVVTQPVGLGSGNKSYFQSGASTDSEHEFDFTPVIDLCNGGFVRFAWRFGGDPDPVAEVFRVGLSGTTNEDQGAYIQFQSNGLVAVFSSSTAGDAALTLFTGTVDTWYNVTLTPDCALGRTTAVVESLGVTVGVGTADAAGVFVDLLDFRVLNPAGVASGAVTQYVDNLELVNVIFPDIITADATVAVTGLTGFQVDPSGTTVVARTDSGDFVRSYNGISLVNAGNFETNCNRADGVMAEKEFVGFFDCDAGGSNDPNFLRIRDPSLSAPSFTCSDCETEPDMDLRQEGVCGAGFPSRTTMIQLGEIAFAKLNYLRSVGSELGFNDPHAVAWAFSTGTGKVGVAEYTAVSTGCDEKLEQSKTFSTATPNQICSWVVGGRQKIAAVSSTVTTQLFEWTPRLTTTASGQQVLTGDFTETPQTYPGLQGGSGVGCGTGKFVVGLGAGSPDLFVYSTATNQPLWSRDVIAGASGLSNRGVTMTADGLWVAYRDATFSYIAHAGNGTVVATITNPAGTFSQMALNADGSQFYYVTTTSINRFQIWPYTTGSPGCIGCDPDPGLDVGGDDDSGEGIFGGAGARVGASLGVGSFGGGLFLAVLSIGLFAFAFFTETGGAKIMAYVGAVVGFVAAWAFGFIPTAVVFGIIVIAAIIWYVMSRGPAEA